MKYLIMLLVMSCTASQDSFGGIEYKLGPPPIRTFTEGTDKVLKAWTVVQHHYPTASTLVRKIRVAKIDTIYCDCWGAVWPSRPTTIYLDVDQLKAISDFELQALLVHEMIHVGQFNSGYEQFTTELDIEAYAEQARYKHLKSLSSDIVPYE